VSRIKSTLSPRARHGVLASFVVLVAFALGPFEATAESVRAVAQLDSSRTITAPLPASFSAPKLTVTGATIAVLPLSGGAVPRGEYDAVPPGEVDIPNRDAVRWLAANYTSVLQTDPDAPGVFAATEAAILQLTGHTHNTSEATQDERTQELTQQLLAAVDQWHQGRDPGRDFPLSYPTQYSLYLTVGLRRVEDATVEAHITGDGVELPNQRALLTANGATSWMLTGASGSTQAVSWQDGHITGQATWEGAWRPGTLLKRSDGGPTLMTLQAWPVMLHAAVAERYPGLSGLDYWPNVQDTLSKIPFGVPVAIILGLVLAGGIVALPILGDRIRIPLAVGVAVAYVIGLAYFCSQLPQTRTVRSYSSSATLTPEVLRVSCVDATSSFPSSDPSSLVDGKQSTAWVSGRTLGSGQGATFHFAQSLWLTDIRLWNGDQATNARFVDNGRASEVRLYFDGGETRDLLVRNVLGMQQWPIHPPVFTAAVALRVESYWSPYESVAISEVQFLGSDAGRDGKSTTENYPLAATALIADDTFDRQGCP
jgi:hypothetical protein